MIWLTKLKSWALGVCAFVAMIAAAFWLGRRKGVAATKQADAATAAAQTIHSHEVRADVERETAKLPDAPAQALADADPASAAGQLRTDGWLRD